MKGRAGGSTPGDGIFVADLQQQLKPVIKVLVVALQVLAEEREGLQIGAAPGGDFGTSRADQIQRCEVLEDADRVGAGKHRDGAGQADVLGLCRGGSQHDRRGGNGKVLAVVLPHAKDVESCLVGHPRPLEDVAHARGRIHRLALGVAGELAEGEDADLERRGGTHAPATTSAPIRAVMKSRTSSSSAALMPWASPG